MCLSADRAGLRGWGPALGLQGEHSNQKADVDSVQITGFPPGPREFCSKAKLAEAFLKPDHLGAVSDMWHSVTCSAAKLSGATQPQSHHAVTLSRSQALSGPQFLFL